MDVKTGVDDLWIADSRIALKELLRGGTKETVAEMGALAADYADAMRDERQRRGGRRDPNDPREMMALAQEHLPSLLALFESIFKTLDGKKKRAKSE